MVRSTLKLILLAILVVAGSAGLLVYQRHNSVETQLHVEKQKNAELRQIAQRLQSESRAAEVIVSDRDTVNGVVYTTLLFVEYARDGSSLPAKRFRVEGEMAHIDAMVIKFEGRYVADKDPLRGSSIALFTRVFGDRQTPEKAFAIDAPDRIPDIYRDTDPRVSPFEQQLWNDFWKLVEDEKYRREQGVRVAQGESVWTRFEPGKLYTITIDANGGPNIRSEPLKGIYSEALKHREAL